MIEYSVIPEQGQLQLGDMSIKKANINNSVIPVPKSPKMRFVFSNIKLSNIKHYACSIHGGILENIVIDKLTGGKGVPTFLWGCVYSEVVIKGDISGILFRWKVDPDDQKMSKKFLFDSIERYSRIPWALDIKDAKFSIFQAIEGVPSSLVKRNTDWHFVLSRENARLMLGDIKEYGVWSVVSQDLIESGLEDTVVVLPQKGKDCKSDKEFALKLKSQGFID